MSARSSTIRPLADRDLDGLPLNSLIHDAFRIRSAETKLLELFAAGELNGTVHTCVGQELFPIVLARYLHADDYVVSNHRGHGHYLSVTGDFEGLVAEVMGRTSGASGGYGGSQHLRTARFYSNGIQGGMTPIAVGLAQALKEESTRNLCVCFIGVGQELFPIFLARYLRADDYVVSNHRGHGHYLSARAVPKRGRIDMTLVWAQFTSSPAFALAAVVGSTIITMVITAVVMRGLERLGTVSWRATSVNR